MDKSVLTPFDRVCLIVIALIFYLAIRALQSAHDDISAIARNYERTEERITRLEDSVSAIEKFIEE